MAGPRAGGAGRWAAGRTRGCGPAGGFRLRGPSRGRRGSGGGEGGGGAAGPAPGGEAGPTRGRGAAAGSGARSLPARLPVTFPSPSSPVKNRTKKNTVSVVFCGAVLPAPRQRHEAAKGG